MQKQQVPNLLQFGTFIYQYDKAIRLTASLLHPVNQQKSGDILIKNYFAFVITIFRYSMGP